MIELLQFMVQFCFWFFLAMILLTLCGLGLWVVVTLIQTMRHRR